MEDAEELMVQPNGAMEQTEKRGWVMQDGVVLDDVVMEEEDGGWQKEKRLLNSCRGGTRAFPRRSSPALCWGWRDALLGCCLRPPSLDASQQLRVLTDASEAIALSIDFRRVHQKRMLATLAGQRPKRTMFTRFQGQLREIFRSR